MVAERGGEEARAVRRVGTRCAALRMEGNLPEAACRKPVSAKLELERHVGTGPVRDERNLPPVRGDYRQPVGTRSVAERNRDASHGRRTPDAPAPREHEERSVRRYRRRLGEVDFRPVAARRVLSLRESRACNGGHENEGCSIFHQRGFRKNASWVIANAQSAGIRLSSCPAPQESV